MTATEGTWVLYEELASKRLGKNIYFCRETQIGPMATDKLEEAARFESEQEAKSCSAYCHALSFYEPRSLAR